MKNKIKKTISTFDQFMQDPKQKELWAETGANGKWLKDTNQNPNEIYEPNYESCKL